MAKINAIGNKSAELTIDPGASGDSFVQFDINGTGEFRIGVDDDDSDKFKISAGSALGSSDTFVITASGEITKPLQPAFLAIVTSQIDNVTGDNTTYAVAYDTEVFDVGGDFSSTTFIAPITGKYLLTTIIGFGDISSHTGALAYFNTSNRNYLFMQTDPEAVDNSSDQYSTSCSMICDMDASDTAVVQVNISGGAKTVDMISNGSTDPYNAFAGSLLV